MARLRTVRSVSLILLSAVALLTTGCPKPPPAANPGQVLAEAEADLVRANYKYSEEALVIRSTLEEKRLLDDTTFHGSTTVPQIGPGHQWTVRESTVSLPLFILGPERRVRAVMFGPKQRVMDANVGDELKLSCLVGGFTESGGRLLLDLDLCKIID